MTDDVASEEHREEAGVLPVSIPPEGLKNGQWRLEALFASGEEEEM